MTETDSFLGFYFNCKRRFKRFSEEKILRYQQLRAEQLVKYVVNHSPFFREHYRGFDLENVWNLPRVNKKIMMENLTTYNTVGLTKEELLTFLTRIEKESDFNTRYKGFNVAMSSGTSGSKGIVITSPAEEKYLQAAFFARFAFPMIVRIKWAFLLRITTPAFQVKKFGQQLTHISLKQPLKAIRAQLQSFKPNILSAPPSMLKLLAKEINEERLAIKPKRVVSYAEVLEPELKEELEEVFQTPIHQIYQASEGAIALTCKHGNLHINEDLVKLEVLNRDGTPTEPGEPCQQLIITDLHKKSQPIIRYELNDMLIISPEKCSCGSAFKVIERIIGRADDLFWGLQKETREEQFIFPDYIRRAIIMSSDNIDDYQAIQRNFEKIIVRITMKNKENDKEQLKAALTRNIQKVFDEHLCLQPNIEVRFEKPIAQVSSGKLIRIKRDFALKR